LISNGTDDRSAIVRPVLPRKPSTVDSFFVSVCALVERDRGRRATGTMNTWSPAFRAGNRVAQGVGPAVPRLLVTNDQAMTSPEWQTNIRAGAMTLPTTCTLVFHPVESNQEYELAAGPERLRVPAGIAGKD
jgi:hypothetical protein